MLINAATITSHKSDFCRCAASINHRKWAVLMSTTGTYWHVQRHMICTLQEKQQALRTRRCFSPPQQQIWYTGSKQSCVNSAWINHPLLSISLRFTLCLLFLCVVHLCRSLRRGRCCKLCEKAPDLLPPCPEIEMNSLILEVDMPYSICKPWLFQPQSAHAVFIL